MKIIITMHEDALLWDVTAFTLCPLTSNINLRARFTVSRSAPISAETDISRTSTQRIIHLSPKKNFHNANITNIVGFKGAIDGSDDYSDAGVIWHEWDKKTNYVTMTLLEWDREGQAELIPRGGMNKYPMGL